MLLASYEIYVSNDGNNWGGAIASGSSSSGVITFNTQNARYVRVMQTGSKGNYWSIHEFYALNSAGGNDLPNGTVDIGEIDTPDPDPIDPITISNLVKIEGYQISSQLKGFRVFLRLNQLSTT